MPRVSLGLVTLSLACLWWVSAQVKQLKLIFVVSLQQNTYVTVIGELHIATTDDVEFYVSLLCEFYPLQELKLFYCIPNHVHNNKYIKFTIKNMWEVWQLQEVAFMVRWESKKLPLTKNIVTYQILNGQESDTWIRVIFQLTDLNYYGPFKTVL